ncbi:hypothetical protein T12_8439 [Trichinella patagoniensis]|uniref:Uncharacterized protein n=2 Tax=Trichinella TaxID=6333 RepID=A0A0V0ZJK0_9BILA|nr:hypothetical protein T05_6822 [Trichinella murrelli]KRY12462.1 hypothetical protein T12_8439 [Trichinella patagoniensis]
MLGAKRNNRLSAFCHFAPAMLDVCMDPPIGLDDEVGHIILERQSKGAESRHWEMMIQNQDETLEMWHKLKKEWC